MAFRDRSLAILFFFSGAVALMYQVVWQRQFALLIGSAAPATAAVLAACLAGLGIGSYVAGRFAPRAADPLRLYAILEILIAAGALLVMGMQRGFEQVYPSLFSLQQEPGVHFAAKVVFVFIALFLPSFCMGGTLPVLARLVDRGSRRYGVTAGLLYVTNTAGAGMGAVSVPFLFLPLLGGAGTVGFCIGANLALAAIAWRWSGHAPESQIVEKRLEERKRSARVPVRSVRLPLFALAALSGGTVFALQVLWNRALAQVHSNTVHSFALIVSVVILALALGGQGARMALRRGVPPGRIISASWIFGGASVLAAPFLFLWLTNGLDFLGVTGAGMESVPRLLLLTLAVLLVPMGLLGMAFPALLEEAGRTGERDVSDTIGRVFATNIAGTVAGALVAGFVLPVWFGMWGAMAWGGLVLIVTGVIERAGETSMLQTRRVRLLIWLGLIAVVAVPAAKIDLPRVQILPDQRERLLDIREGAHGITAVVERPGSRRLKHNNHYILGGTAAAGDERAQGHLPLLLHPVPRKVAFLGVGTGITASSALFHPAEQITAIELVPEVIELARLHFSEANAGVLSDERTRVVIEDARNYLRGTREKFDVIIGDLVVPWRQGEGALFTLEHFQAARAALEPGGLFCQWLPLFQLSEPDLEIALRTFLAVFPRATLWRGDFSPLEPAVALIGAAEPSTLQTSVIRSRLASAHPDPLNPHLADASGFWMHFVGELRAGDVPENGLLNRDGRPLIELRRRGTEQPLTGRLLHERLSAFQSQPDEIQAQLSAAERAAIRAGTVLSEMMLLIIEGDGSSAQRAQTQLKELLPPETFTRLFERAP